MQKLKNRRGILRPQLKKYGPAYLLGLITLLMVDYVELFVPKLIGEATDGLAAHLLDVRGILIIAGKIVLCGLAVMFGRFWWRRFIFGSARKIERALRDQMFEHLETLPLRYFNTHKTGDSRPTWKPSAWPSARPSSQVSTPPSSPCSCSTG